MSKRTGAEAPQARPGDSAPDMDEALSRVRTTPRPSAGGSLSGYKRTDVRRTMMNFLGR